MSRRLFFHSVDAFKQHDNYFIQRDSTGRLRILTLQKGTAAIRILAYHMPTDATDKYMRIGEFTTIECMKKILSHNCSCVFRLLSEVINNIRCYQTSQHHSTMGISGNVR